MNESRVKELLAPVRPEWDAPRAEEVRRRVQRRLRRRARTRVAVVAVAVLALLVAGARWLRPPGAPELLTLDDGSTVRPLGRQSDVRETDASPSRRVWRVGRGGAAFDVRPNPGRLFRVEAGPIAVEVLGTAFTVERAGGQVGVAVERGRVRVSWAKGSALLAAGQGGLFPPAMTSPGYAEAPGAPAGHAGAQAPMHGGPSGPGGHPAPVPPPTAPATEPPSVSPPRAWRSLAQRGRYDEAYRALGREGPAAVPDEPGALLLAADVARLSRHPAQAVAPLRKLLDRHARDPRAGLAAFTLGLVFLEELGRPREAAEAFARSRRIDADGDLAGDALAHEVEAYFRAGDQARARQAAEEYLRRYPSGRRVKAVRTFDGLE